MGRIFSIMSGKGGVGKSTLAAALAEFYARQGKNVTLLDGDTGLRSADLLLGMQNKVVYDLGDIVSGSCDIVGALVPSPQLENLTLLAAPQMLRPSDVKNKDMGRIITALSEEKDILILDAPAGIGRGLKNLLGAAAEPVIVATPDDVCVRDAEKLSELLFQREEPKPGIVFNRVDRDLVHKGDMTAPSLLASSLDLPLLGILPESPRVYRALLRHQSILTCGDKRFVKEIEAIAGRLLGADVPLPSYQKSPVRAFFRRGGVSA